MAYDSTGPPNDDAVDVLVDCIFKAPFDTDECCGCYPLHYACVDLDFPLIERMLQHGADVNFIDQHTVLIELVVALSKGLIVGSFCDLMRCVKLLLDYGADVTAQDSEGKTVFDYAVAGSKLEALLREYTDARKPLLKKTYYWLI